MHSLPHAQKTHTKRTQTPTHLDRLEEGGGHHGGHPLDHELPLPYGEPREAAQGELPVLLVRVLEHRGALGLAGRVLRTNNNMRGGGGHGANETSFRGGTDARADKRNVRARPGRRRRTRRLANKPNDRMLGVLGSVRV